MNASLTAKRCHFLVSFYTASALQACFVKRIARNRKLIWITNVIFDDSDIITQAFPMQFGFEVIRSRPGALWRMMESFFIPGWFWSVRWWIDCARWHSDHLRRFIKELQASGRASWTLYYELTAGSCFLEDNGGLWVFRKRVFRAFLTVVIKENKDGKNKASNWIVPVQFPLLVAYRIPPSLALSRWIWCFFFSFSLWFSPDRFHSVLEGMDLIALWGLVGGAGPGCLISVPCRDWFNASWSWNCLIVQPSRDPSLSLLPLALSPLLLHLRAPVESSRFCQTPLQALLERAGAGRFPRAAPTGCKCEMRVTATGAFSDLFDLSSWNAWAW